MQLLVDSGVMTAEDASASPMRNVILQAMGHQREIKIAVGKIELRDRDCIVICSDGLTVHVSDEEIKSAVIGARPETAVAALLDLALERGGKDNITVIVAGIGGELAPPAADETPEKAVEVIKAFDAKPTPSSD